MADPLETTEAARPEGDGTPAVREARAAELLCDVSGVQVYHAHHLDLLAAATRREDGTVCDLTWVDAPYSEQTQSGHADGAQTANRAAEWATRPTAHRDAAMVAEAKYALAGKGTRRIIDYAPWTPADVDEFVAAWGPATRGWLVSVTDEFLKDAWRAALKADGRYVFGSIPYVAPGSRVRMVGDGPPLWACWLVFARPRSEPWSKWNTSAARLARGAAPPMPGAHVHPDADRMGPREAYVLPPGEGTGHTKRMPIVGGKSIWLSEQVVQQASAVGDIVCDPCCGGGGAGVAAILHGRRALLGDVDRGHAEIAADAMPAAVIERERQAEEARATAANYPRPPRAEQIALFREADQ